METITTATGKVIQCNYFNLRPEVGRLRIQVAGIDNQDKFVGCAQASQRSMEIVNKYISDNGNGKEEKADG